MNGVRGLDVESRGDMVPVALARPGLPPAARTAGGIAWMRVSRWCIRSSRVAVRLRDIRCEMLHGKDASETENALGFVGMGTLAWFLESAWRASREAGLAWMAFVTFYASPSTSDNDVSYHIVGKVKEHQRACLPTAITGPMGEGWMSEGVGRRRRGRN